MSSPLCPSCGYDLRAHVTQWGARCPECGCGWWPEDLTHQGTQAWRPFIEAIVAIAIPPLLAVAMLVFGLMQWWENSPGWYNALFFAVIGTTPIAHQVFAMKCCSRHDWPYLFGSLIGIVLTLASVAVFYVTILVIMALFVCFS